MLGSQKFSWNHFCSRIACSVSPILERSLSNLALSHQPVSIQSFLCCIPKPPSSWSCATRTQQRKCHGRKPDRKKTTILSNVVKRSYFCTHKFYKNTWLIPDLRGQMQVGFLGLTKTPQLGLFRAYEFLVKIAKKMLLDCMLSDEIWQDWK